MNRSTPEDEAFKRKVAEKFNQARESALRRGLSYEDFLRTLGVTRAGFCKYLTQESIPSLRVLHRARKYWGVHLAYGELGDRYVKAQKTDPRQMTIQFPAGDLSSEQIEIKKFSAKGETAAELLLKIDFPKTA